MAVVVGSGVSVSDILYLSSVVLAFIALIVGFVVLCFSVYLHFFVHQKYKHIPGPPRTSFFLGHILDIRRYMKEGRLFSDAVLDWTVEHGPVIVIFIIHRVIINANSPEAVKEFLVSDKHPKSRKTYVANVATLCGTRALGRGLVTEIDHDIWARHRAICDPAFHRKALRKYMDTFNTCGDMLIEKLSKMADGNTEVTLLEELHRTTLDVIAKVAFGLDLNLLYDEDSKFTDAIKKVLRGMDYMSKQALQYSRNYRKETIDACRLLRDTGRECIRNRLKAKSSGEAMREDVLTLLMESSEGYGDGNGDEDMERILDEFVTFFIAGMETTANTLAFIFVEICLSEEIMYRLRTEVDAVVNDDKEVQFEELSKLTYMATVLKESLRKYPPAIGTVRDVAFDTTLHGVTIPQGAMVITSTYVLCRLEKYFKDPLVFDPDRFSREKEVIPHTYLPFAVGPRSCIGQQFAMIEAKVLISKLLKNFNFGLVPDQSIKVVQAGTITPKDGCKLYLTPRNS